MHRAICPLLLLAALLLCWPASPASAMRLADKDGKSEMPAIPSGEGGALRSQGADAPAAGTLRTPDGAVITVPKVQNTPRQGGTSVKKKE